MRKEPQLPEDVTVEDVETYLDRVALEIHHSKNPTAIFPMYEWLERQLEKKQREKATMDSAMARVSAIKARTT